MNIEELKESIIWNFSTHWELNDKAHQKAHFEEVFQCGLIINGRLNLGFDQKLILFGAYFHDLFAWSRLNHHVLSSEFIENTDHPFILEHLNKEQRVLVASGCREHRASYTGAFSNAFSELINAADRGIPGHVEEMISRSHLYWMKTFPDLSKSERRVGVISHIKEKFGSDGYARYPKLYERVFGTELTMQRLAIDNL